MPGTGALGPWEEVEDLRCDGGRDLVDEEMVQFCSCQLGRLLSAMLTGVVPWHLRRRVPGVAGRGGERAVLEEVAKARAEAEALRKELAEVRAEQTARSS